ncbi:gas vesicle protein GvpO [Streptomyces sp. NBC_01565]|uniref:gas vesicle protein GvpO n=1 Tax=unclassified Streptomyces TaxID=2593676 RepID=UPI00224CBD4C|nr:gas vesicle protein GvpO [Streptomyces sp. NBC_01565]MCX4547133.1 gas vesicle protein [Streptomyces sp. NBC_01565]
MANTSDNGTKKKADEGKPPRTAAVILSAMQQLSELLGLPAEAVSSCERAEDGTWNLTVEIVELPRVPDTMTLIASYDVEVDSEGELLGYRRVRRYERGRADRR